MTVQPAITFEDVCFETDDALILKRITGTIYKGKITTLIGPSGAGKTTLLKMCNGLISPTSGTICINEQPIDTYEPTALRRLVGIALQSAPVLRTTVFDNLALPLTLQQQTLSKEKALASLEAVGLDERFLTRLATELSGGQKQKLAIARTLINQSSILLLDEITAALDPSSAREIEELIVKLNKQFGVTIIWITHNFEQARRLSHYTWLLKDGALIEATCSRAVFKNNSLSVQQFLRGEEQL